MLIGHAGAGDGAANFRRESCRGSLGFRAEGNTQVQCDGRERRRG